MQVELSYYLYTVIYTILRVVVSRVHRRSSVIYSYLHIVSRVHHRSRVIYTIIRTPPRARERRAGHAPCTADGLRETASPHPFSPPLPLDLVEVGDIVGDGMHPDYVTTP